MSPRARVALVQLLLGAWIAVTASSWAVATASFVLAGRLAVEHPGEPEAHAAWREAVRRPAAVARYQAAEMNRWAFTAVGRARLVLGALALLLVAWPTVLRRGAVATASLAALLVTVQVVLLVPWADATGRVLGMARDVRTPELEAAARTMATLHGLYGVADLAGVGLVLATAWSLGRRRRDADDAGVDVT